MIKSKPVKETLNVDEQYVISPAKRIKTEVAQDEEGKAIYEWIDHEPIKGTRTRQVEVWKVQTEDYFGTVETHVFKDEINADNFYRGV